jgi:hypothetical protein
MIKVKNQDLPQSRATTNIENQNLTNDQLKCNTELQYCYRRLKFPVGREYPPKLCKQDHTRC